ncbi:hypothetical protein MMC29_006111 [Sticta canariensis]|nr:hypothetical protein [Sticta canariensis]
MGTTAPNDQALLESKNLQTPARGRSPGDSEWQHRTYPDNGSSTLPVNVPPFHGKLQGSPISSRLDFSSFINSMDDLAFAYFSLIREFASRTLQGNALQYGGLYLAMVSQKAEDEYNSRCSVIEFSDQGSRSRSFTGYDDFKNYVDTSWLTGSTRCLFILEDLPMRYVCILGSRMRIHPSVFACHYSTEDSSTMSDNVSYLPSILEPSTSEGLDYASDDGSKYEEEKRRITLRYPVTMPRGSAKQHPDPSICPPWLKPSTRFMDQSAYPKFLVERCLDTPSIHDQWDATGEVFQLDGQVTYWSTTRDNQRWTSTLLVDPSLKDPAHLAMIAGETGFNLTREVRYPELEDRGNAYITPNPIQWHPTAAFTKYILHDDILTHFSVADSGPGGSPLAVTPFVRDLVISKWIAHLNHIRRCFAHTRAALFSNGDFHGGDNEDKAILHTSRFGADWQEWMFESLTRWTTDLVFYRLDAETNMRALGIDVDDLHSHGLVGRRETQMWRYICSSCQDLQGMFESLTNSYTQVVALREAQASNVQASNVRWLTILGTLFVPVNVVAGVMSMGGEYLPGEDKFWMFFAVLVPVIVVVGTILLLLMKGTLLFRSIQKLYRRNFHDSSTSSDWEKNCKLA